MSNREIKSWLRTARVILSFGLLGAVACGVVFGGLDVDVRPWGAAVGAGGALAYKLFHIF